MATKRIADDLGSPNHDEAMQFFNQLLIDLKKQLLGYEHDEITMDRLNEGTKHVADIQNCRSPDKFY